MPQGQAFRLLMPALVSQASYSLMSEGQLGLASFLRLIVPMMSSGEYAFSHKSLVMFVCWLSPPPPPGLVVRLTGLPQGGRKLGETLAVIAAKNKW